MSRAIVAPLVTLILALGIIVEEVQARDFGQYANSSAERRKWFKDLAPQVGTWGCGRVAIRVMSSTQNSE